MKKQTGLMLFLIMAAIPIRTATCVTLERVMKPTALIVHGEQLVVAGERTVQQYAIKNGEFIRFVGRVGEGPGEFDDNPKTCFQPPDKLLIQTSFKLMTFNTDGKFVVERKFKYHFTRVLPFGKNYVALMFKSAGEKGDFLHITTLLNENFLPTRELSRTISPNPLKRINIVYYPGGFAVYNNKIYVPRQVDEGIDLVLDVFNRKGEKIKTIKKEKKSTKIPGEYKAQKIAEIKEEKKEYWHLLKDTLDFPEYYPALRSLSISNDKIYIKTWIKKDDNAKFTVFDLNGNSEKNIYLPDAESLFTFYNSKYYYLKENYYEDSWELHVVAVE